MNINFSPINFKGYDAAPLKAIHVDTWTSKPIKSELKQIASAEGFSVRCALDYYKWAQDMKMLIEKNGKPFCIANNRTDLTFP